MKNWPETTIETWTHLQDAIDSLSSRCIFRGQGSSDWPLIPSFNRLIPQVTEGHALWLEKRMILRFRSEAHLHLPASVMPPNFFKFDQLDTYVEWLMLMQHYGAPTRLLDWTGSPYVALYFAVDEQWESEAAIWYFDPAPASTALYQHYKKEPDELLDYADYPPEDIRLEKGLPLLYTAEKKMRTPREVAQQGYFTFTNRILANHQDVVHLACNNCLYGRLLIPNRLKPEFFNRLSSMNVTAAALFPGVEGICNSLRDTVRLAALQP